MCGRYSQSKDPATLAEEFDALDATEDWPGPDRNVAPTTTVIAVVDRHPRDDGGAPDPARLERSLRTMRWGLVPSWADDPSVGNRLINARAESVTGKPAFRRAAARRRCLLPADGWFEWRRGGEGRRGQGARKTPFFLTLPGRRSLALAGLWETWRSRDAEPGDRPLVTTTVVTTEAAGPPADLHPRMPLFLPADRWAQWLDPGREDPSDLLVPPPPELLAEVEMRQVSSRVNDVRNHGAELLDEVHDEPEQVGLDLDVPAR